MRGLATETGGDGCCETCACVGSIAGGFASSFGSAAVAASKGPVTTLATPYPRPAPITVANATLNFARRHRAIALSILTATSPLWRPGVRIDVFGGGQC